MTLSLPPGLMCLVNAQLALALGKNVCMCSAHPVCSVGWGPLGGNVYNDWIANHKHLETDIHLALRHASPASQFILILQDRGGKFRLNSAYFKLDMVSFKCLLTPKIAFQVLLGT